jgi:MFS family permease
MRRRVLVGFGALGIWWGAWGVLVPDIQEQAGVGDGELGAALACVGLGALVSMRSTGGLIDRHGQVVLPVTIVLFAVSGLLPAVVNGPVGLAGALFVVGATSGSLDVGINTAAVDAETSTGEPIMNLAHGVFSLAVIGTSAATGLLRTADASPLSVLLVMGVVLLACAVSVQRNRTAALAAAEHVPAGAGPPWWHPPRRLLLIGVLTALAFLVESVWQTWSAVHLERNLDASPLVGSFGPSLFAASAAAGRLGGHRLEGRYDRRALVRTGAAVAAGGTLVAALAPTTVLVLAGIVAAGAGTAICAPILFGLAGEGVVAQRRGAAIGTVATLGYLGFVLAPAIVGGLADVLTLPTALAVTTGAALLLSATAHRARAASPDEPL